MSDYIKAPFSIEATLNAHPALLAFAKKHYTIFDESHNFEGHIMRVIRNADEIIKCGHMKFTTAEEIILTYALILHDVVDHKYTGTISRADLEAFLQEQLHKFEFVNAVMEIIDNVSWSKQMAGIAHDHIACPRLLYIIRDADRIDAIGNQGIERCLIFNTIKRPSATSAEIIIDVRAHVFEKLYEIPKHFHTSVATVITKERGLIDQLDAFIERSA